MRREKWIRILFPPPGNVLLTISDRCMVNDFDYVYDPTLTGNNYIQNGALGANGFINPAGGPPGAAYD